jgi:hypothetical protein
MEGFGLFVNISMGIMKCLKGFILIINKNILILHSLLFLEHNVHLTMKNIGTGSSQPPLETTEIFV